MTSIKRRKMWFKVIVALLIGLYFYFKANQDILVGLIIALVILLILNKLFKGRKKKDYTPYWHR